MQSYLEFLQQNMNTRSAQKAYLENLRQNEPFFEGQELPEVARTMANYTGFKPLKRFSEPSAPVRALDALGSFVTEGFRGITPADYIPGEQMSEGMNTPISEHTGQGLYNLSRNVFGAEEDTAEAFRMGGQAVPEIVGQMGMMLGGVALAPVTGGASLAAVPATYATMYGQGLGGAYEQDEFGLRAHASAAVGPISSAFAMGIARPLTSKASQIAMRMTAPLTSKGGAEAIRAGMQVGGEVGLRSVLKDKAVDVITKGALLATTELIVEGTQAAIGTGAEAIQEAIIDPTKFVTETMWDKNFWIPVLTSEAIEAVFSTTIGRMRNPLPQAGVAETTTTGGETRVDPYMREGITQPSDVLGTMYTFPTNDGTMTLESPGDALPMYDLGAIIASGIDSADADADAKLVSQANAEQQTASAAVAAATLEARSRKGEMGGPLDETDTSTKQTPNVLTSTEEVVSTVATAYRATTNPIIHENTAAAAQDIVNEIVESTPPGTTPEAFLQHTLDIKVGEAARRHRDHRIPTAGDPGNYVAFRNAETHNVGVFTQLSRNGSVVNNPAMVANKQHPGVALTVNHFIDLANGVTDKKHLEQLFQVTQLTVQEYQAFQQVAQNVKGQYDALPFGVSFAPDAKYSKEYQANLTKFFEDSGIQAALVRGGRKLRFGLNAKSMDETTLQSNPLDYMASMDAAKWVGYDNGKLHYITRERSFDRHTDVHEIGHSIGRSLRDGLFGDDYKAEWEQILTKAMLEVDASAAIGVKSAEFTAQMLDASGTDPAKVPGMTLEGLHAHARKVKEIEANLFQYYFLGTENKWSKFVQKNFPKIHELFTNLMNGLKALVTPKAPFNKKLDLYAPNAEAAAQFFSRMFEQNAAVQKNVKDHLTKTRKAYGLDKPEAAPASDAFVDVYTSARNSEQRSRVTATLKAWKDGLGDQSGPTASDLTNLIDNLGAVKEINTLDVHGAADVSGVMLQMPWLRSLRHDARSEEVLRGSFQATGKQLTELRNRLKLSALGDEKKTAWMEQMLLTPEELTKLENDWRNASQAEWADIRKDFEILSRRNKMLLDLTYIGKAVGEMITTEKNEQRTNIGPMAKSLLQADNVIKQWMLGNLKGQDGIPFNEPDTPDRMKFFSTQDSLKVASKKDDRAEFLRIIHKHYPILSAALQESVATARKRQKGFVNADGKLSFDKDKVGKKPRMQFDTEIEAFDAARVMQQRSEYSGVALKVTKEEVSGGKGKPKVTKFFIAAETQGHKKLHTVFTETQNNARIAQEAREMAEEVTGGYRSSKADLTTDLVGEQQLDRESWTNDTLQKIDIARRQAVIEKHGQRIAKTIVEQAGVIRTALDGQFRLGLVPEFIVDQLRTTTEHVRTTREGKEAFKLITQSITGKFDGANNLHELGMAYVEAHLKNPESARQMFLETSLVSGPIADLMQSYVNFAKKAADGYIHGEVQRLMDPEVHGFGPPQVTPRAANLVPNLVQHNVMNDPDVVSGTSAALSVLPGPRHGGKLKATLSTVNSIFGKTVGVAQKIHAMYGQGAYHRAMVNPKITPLGEALWVELRDTKSSTDVMIEPVLIEGKYNPDAEEGFRFTPDPRARLDENSPIFKLKSTLKNDQLLNEILLAQSAFGMKFEHALKSDNTDIRNDAHELLNRIAPEDRPTVQEALERFYYAKGRRNEIVQKHDVQNHKISFALLLGLDQSFKGSADDAMNFSERFYYLSRKEQFDALVNELNKTPEKAMQLVDNFEQVRKAMAKKFLMMKNTPWHLDERRFNDYHVSVVFKKGFKPNPGVGVKLSDKKVHTGYYGFDTLPESLAFMAEMKAQGHEVPKAPKDYKKHQRNYKPIDGAFGEVMDQIHTTRRLLVQTILHGEVDEATMKQVTEVLDSQTADIMAANDVVSESKHEKVKREFVAGRENLDMVDQFMNSSRRLASALSRRRTDMIFKLYGNDSAIRGSDDFAMMDNFRETLRYRDSDAQRMINAIGFSAFIGLNPSSGIVELFQFQMTLSPMLLEAGASVKDAFGVPASLFKKATHAALTRLRGKDDADIWSEKDHVDLLREAERAGALHQFKHHDMSESRFDNVVDLYKGKVTDRDLKGNVGHMAKATYSFMNKSYAFFNRINAELGLIATYEVLKKNQYGKKALQPQERAALFTKAMQLNDLANGSLQQVGRPGWFNTRYPAGRNASSAFWSLQSYVNALFANQIRFFLKASNHKGQWTAEESRNAKKAVVGLLGVQAATMGTMGFTLVPGIAKLIEQVFGLDIEDEMREFVEKGGKDEVDKAFLSDLAVHGLPAALGFPTDFQSRMSVGSLGPVNSYDGFDALALGGPLVGLVEGIFRDLPKVKKGRMGAGEFGLNLLPMGLRRGARLAFFDDGKVYDAQKRFMFDPTVGEKISMGLGFNTMRAKKEMKRRMEQDEGIKSDSGNRERVGNMIMDELNRGSVMRAQQMLHESIAQQGLQTTAEINSYVKSVADLEVSKKLGPDTPEGAGAESMRAARLYRSPTTRVPHEHRRYASDEIVKKLGFQPTTTNATLRTIRAKDALQTLNPSLTDAMASKLIMRNPRAARMFNTTRQVSSLQGLLSPAGLESPGLIDQ